MFDPDHWERAGAITGQAAGRGSALLLDTPFGEVVLREYLRGGWPARVSRDRYFFTGYQRSRPLAEFRILAALAERGLPVPRPVAALCDRLVLFYRGWLMTSLLPNVTPLADMLAERGGDAALWRSSGRVIGRFHDAGVVHADLNARNILVGPDDAIYLIDFDRARISAGNARAFSANLARLRRSLEKLWPAAGRERLDPCWRDLLSGYRSRAESA